MRKLYLLIVFFCCASILLAQKNLSADKLYQMGEWELAFEKYGKLLITYPTYGPYLYRYARCADELGDHATAIQYYDLAGDKYMDKYFYLGEIYYDQWNTELAIEAYSTYLPTLKEDTARILYVQQKLDYAEKLQRYLGRVERLLVLDSIMVPKELMLEQCLLSAEAGKLTYDTIAGISYTNQRGDFRLWSERKDSNLVLCSSHRLLDTWTVPEQLPERVNFSSSQISPYLLGDGVTLYFAAQDSNGLGGYDLYVTRYNTVTEQYTEPDNIGMPYNSPANEYMLVLDEGKRVGYLATDRSAPEGYVHVFSFVLPKHKQYWRGLHNDTLVAYAQLRKLEMVDVQKYATGDVVSPVATISGKQSTSINFVMSDLVVYTSVDDFRSPEAKLKFEELKTLQQQIAAERDKLSALRVRYMQGDEITQKELAPLILQLEANEQPMQQSYQALVNEIRKIEMSAR